MRRVLNTIPPLYTKEGYFYRFYQMVAEGGNKSHKQLYDQLELELMDKHSVTMYKTYEGFRMAKSRYLQNKPTRDRKQPIYEP